MLCERRECYFDIGLTKPDTSLYRIDKKASRKCDRAAPKRAPFLAFWRSLLLRLSSGRRQLFVRLQKAWDVGESPHSNKILRRKKTWEHCTPQNQWRIYFLIVLLQVGLLRNTLVYTFCHRAVGVGRHVNWIKWKVQYLCTARRHVWGWSYSSCYSLYLHWIDVSS